jgi:AGZA family xanthine/uracil permease-like MFS transporter
VPTEVKVSSKNLKWAAPGDVNAFFGLMLDNVAGLILMVGLLAGAFEFSSTFTLNYMVPGTAIGVLVGDLIFFGVAIRLARKLGRGNVTAMPLGLDTPSTFGMVLFVLGPAYLGMKSQLAADGPLDEDQLLLAQKYTWHIGICCIFISGIFKSVCAFGSNWIRRSLPRAGLLGSLAAIALVLISFLPLIEILHTPVVGLTALAVILTTLVARVSLPFKIPGALGALVIAGVLFYLMKASDVAFGTHLLSHTDAMSFDPHAALMPTGWLEVFRFEWVQAMPDALNYLPIVVPFALATVVGGIDCTESAAAAGDEFDTSQVIGVEAFATLIASLCGGVIQTTPYIGHPAYKAMGGRSAYTLATALFVGGAGLLGYFGYLYLIIPKPTVFPILVFIGIEITSQSFHATPKRHYPAVALACIPALATLAAMYVGKILGDPAMFAAQIGESSLSPQLQTELVTVRMLANGFIITSLLWASGLAMLIDRRWNAATIVFALCGLMTLFGVIHSPLPDGSMFWPWDIQGTMISRMVYEYSAGYLVVAVLIFFLGQWLAKKGDAGTKYDGVDEEPAGLELQS